MEALIEAVRLRDRINKLRKTAKFLLGDTYDADVKFYQDKLLDFQKKTGEPEITKAYIEFLKLVQEKMDNKDYLTIFITAAYAELLEPQKH